MTPPMLQATITTDGSCYDQFKAGGWAAVIKIENNGKTSPIVINGGGKANDIHEMEMRAIIEGIKKLDAAHTYNVTLRCDHVGIIRGIQTLLEQRSPNSTIEIPGHLPCQPMWRELADTLQATPHIHDIHIKRARDDKKDQDLKTAHEQARAGAQAANPRLHVRSTPTRRMLYLEKSNRRPDGQGGYLG